MSNSLNLELPYVEEAQAQKHVTVNDALRRIDSIVQLAVIDRSQASPPGSPLDGDRYLVGLSPTGAWTDRALEVAAYIDGAWEFFTPHEGWVAFVQSENALVYFTGSAWELVTASASIELADQLGINATADTLNRLVVRSRAALFAPDLSQASGDVRIIATKGASSDTASHIFQTDSSGRAEFGLLGSDDFSLKVSADGSTFRDAFTVDSTTAELDLAAMPRVGGTKSFDFSVASRAALMLATIPAEVDCIETRGYSAENDGGGGRYRRVASLPPDGLSETDGSGGIWALTGESVTARQAGALGDGVADDTAALQRAFRSGRNVYIDKGTYLVSDALVTGNFYQRIHGDGRGRTILKVATSFNPVAAGVVKIAHAFVSLEDLQISFDQSAATSRATLVHYPPAVSMVGQSRCRLSRLRFTEAWDGVNATGNTGGAILDDVESGSFNEGFRFAGALDSVELRNCRVWPYNFAANATLYGIYQDGQTIGFRFGRVDDLKMSNCTPFQCRLLLEQSEGHRPFGIINGLALDGSYSRIEMSDGDIALTSLYCTSAAEDDVYILQTGGNLALSDFSFRAGGVANVPLVHVNGNAANCQVQNGKVELGPSTAADGFRVTAGQLAIIGVRFFVNPATVRSGACIRQVGGTLQAFGNTCNRPTTGSGNFLTMSTNDDHVVLGNNSGGWGYQLPGSTSLGVYGPNHDGQSVKIDNKVRFGAINGTSEGGEIQLDGAGANNSISLDNFAGNARIYGLTAGKVFQVLASSGIANISGSYIEWSGGLKLSRGLADEANSTAVGQLALAATTTAIGNTAVGRGALGTASSGSQGVAVGTNAGAACTTGSGNAYVGYNAGANVTGSGNTAVGRNTFAGAPATISNSAALGDGATVTGSNQVQLGNSATTTYAYGAVGNRSDARDKTDVRDTLLGLDFINQLRPVDFRWDYREDYLRPAELPADEPWEPPVPGSKVRTRYHHGLIAQDVAKTVASLGLDFGGYQDHAISGGADVKTIGYSELIGPIVKAIQELSDRISTLEP